MQQLQIVQQQQQQQQSVQQHGEFERLVEAEIMECDVLQPEDMDQLSREIEKER